MFHGLLYATGKLFSKTSGLVKVKNKKKYDWNDQQSCLKKILFSGKMLSLNVGRKRNV